MGADWADFKFGAIVRPSLALHPAKREVSTLAGISLIVCMLIEQCSFSNAYSHWMYLICPFHYIIIMRPLHIRFPLVQIKLAQGRFSHRKLSWDYDCQYMAGIYQDRYFLLIRVTFFQL